jgi:hypothetical protein
MNTYNMGLLGNLAHEKEFKFIIQWHHVPDGLFVSLFSLKSTDMHDIHSSPSYQSASAEYDQIMKICKAGLKLTSEATEILILISTMCTPSLPPLCQCWD